MKSYEKRSAWRYRARAEELRTLADYDHSLQTRSILLRVAEDYDRIARSMENLAEARTHLIEQRADLRFIEIGNRGRQGPLTEKGP